VSIISQNTREIWLIQPEDGPGRGLFHRLWQPLDLANMAGLFEERGFRVRVLDNRVAKRPVREIEALTRNAQLVFVTSAVFDRWQCPPLEISFFFRLTEILDSRRLCILGPHVTERTETFLRKTKAWAAIVGEPEQTALDLAERDPDVGPPEGIDGVAFLDAGGLYHEQPRQNTSEPFHWPQPAFHRLAMHRYHYPLMNRPFAVMEGSRGCPFHCRFCYKGMHPDVYRKKDPVKLAREALMLKQRFDTENIYFMDLEFGVDRIFVERFCKALIRLKAGISWCCQTRASDVDAGLLRLMNEAGCSLIHLGAESGVQRTLDWTRKGLVLADCEKAVVAARSAGIRTALFFGLGFPGETRKDMETTVDWAIHLEPDYASFHKVMPIPGTELQKETRLNPETMACERYPACCVEHAEKDLDRMVRRAYLRFYLRPSYVLKVVRHRRMLTWRALEWFAFAVRS
jgi:anaerobic magnesium-protoporphyrin IX monomethyl ester cyclase